MRLNKPELQVQIDRNRAADLGVNTEDVASALRVMVGGDDRVTRFRDSSVNDDYDVQLRLAETDRNDPAKLGGLLVPRNTGELVRLDNIVSIVHAESPSRIDRQDRQRQVNVRANVGPGFRAGGPHAGAAAGRTRVEHAARRTRRPSAVVRGSSNARSASSSGRSCCR